MVKPINFRPTPVDQALINKLMESDKYKNTADLLRNAIMQLAMVSLDSSDYLSTIASGYEKDVAGD